MGLFSAIAGFFGAKKQAKAATNAANAQVAALQQGVQQIAPYNAAGTDALAGIRTLLGLDGGDGQAAAIAQLQDSPLFKSLMEGGQNTLLANASATGGVRGGNIQRSLADFSADTLTSVIESQLAKLGGLAGQGYNAATDTASLYSGQGAARAGGILGKSNAMAQAYASLGQGAGQLAGAFLPPGMQKFV